MAQYAIVQNFYASKAWRLFRLNLILESMNRSSDKGIHCADCKRLIVNEKEAELDHEIELTPDNVNDADTSLNPKRVKIRCHDCHNKRHKRFGYSRKQVYIVFGCPCSGKTTYVQQRKEHNDIVVDVNNIYGALTGLPNHDNPDCLLSNVMMIYNQLLDQIKTRFGKWSTAWVIGGFPDKYKRDKLANDLGAELIFCECSKDEAMARVMTDEKRKNIAGEYQKYIDKWFDRYTA